MGFVRVGRAGDVPPGEGRVVVAEDRPVALWNVDGELHAIDNTCPHVGGPLGQGFLDGRCAVCPWHGWRFDVTTGRCETVEAAVARFAVRVEGVDVLVSTEPLA